jgi:excinuclease UvrABC nuclease subunit
MKQPETITVTLSDFSKVEVRRISKRERADLYHAALQDRIQMTDSIEELNSRQEPIEYSNFVRRVIALATGKNEQWVNQLSQDDQENIMQAIFELLKDVAEKIRAKIHAVDQIISKQKYG